MDVLKLEDRSALAVYCSTWSRYVAAVRQYRREGLVLTNPDSGRVHTHPAVSIANAAARQLLREFGLTPSAEQRLATVAPDDDDDNPFAG